MTRLKKTLTALSCTAVALYSGMAAAIPISDVVYNSRYSISGMGENRTAIAVKSDYSTGNVLVRYDDNGRTAWVSSNRLLRSYGDSFANDAVEVAGWGLLLGALFCAASDECGNSGSSSSSRSSSSSSTTRTSTGTSETVRDLYVKNDCHDDVTLSIAYMEPDGDWNTNAYTWDYDTGRASFPNIDNSRLRVKGDNVYIHAVSDHGHTWAGSSSGSSDTNWHNPKTGKWMYKAPTFVDSDGDRVLRLTCTA